MRRSARFFPSPHDPPPPWLAGAMASIGLAIAFVLLWQYVENPSGPDSGDLLVGAFGITVLFAIPGMIIVIQHTTKARNTEWDKRARALGLVDLHERVAKADLLPFLDLPLFRFGEPDWHRAWSFARGVVEDLEMMVVNFNYCLQVTPPSLFSGGERRGFTQTIALFPHITGLPDFHLSPLAHEWDSVWPGWAYDLDLGPVVQIIDNHKRYPSLLRGHSPELSLFTSDCVRELGKLTGWTIECQAGQLLVYRVGEIMQADELPYFVNRAIDFVRVLTSQPRTDPASPCHLPDERVQGGDPAAGRR